MWYDTLWCNIMYVIYNYTYNYIIIYIYIHIYIYIYIYYILVLHMWQCTAYIVKELNCVILGGFSQLMGVACNGMYDWAIQTSRQKAYVTLCRLIAVLPEIFSWSSTRSFKTLKGVDNQNRKYNQVLCFRHEIVSHDYWMLDTTKQSLGYVFFHIYW